MALARSLIGNSLIMHQSALFYEDEVDITGIRDSYERQQPQLTMLLENLLKSHTDSACQNVTTEKESAILDNVPCEVLDLIRRQSMSLKSKCSILYRTATVYRHLVPETHHNFTTHVSTP